MQRCFTINSQVAKQWGDIHCKMYAAKEGKTGSITVNVAFFLEIKVLKSGEREI